MITFKKLRYKNFLAAGEHFIEIDLIRSPTVLITGKNSSGKSHILDAMTFSLFGKTFRDINKSQIVNTINKKNCVVELEFSTESKNYLVRRSIKPNNFEIYEVINDELVLVEQDSSISEYQNKFESTIIKMNYDSFTQICIIGKASYTPFMRLPLGKRREVIEDLLGLKVFGTMSLLAKSKIKALKADLIEERHNEELHRQKADSLQSYIDKVQKDGQERTSEIEGEIKILNERIIKGTGILASLQASREQAKDQTIDHEKLLARKEKLLSFKSQIGTKKNSVQKQHDFFNENDICPTCSQEINSDIKSTTISHANEKLKKYEAGLKKYEKDMAKLNDEIYTNNDALDAVREVDEKISKLIHNLAHTEDQINQLNSQLKSDKERASTISEEQELSKELGSLEVYQKNVKETSESLDYYNKINIMLKDDGIKTLIITKYLPQFNNLINGYLQTMGLFIRFDLDESFNETIVSSIYKNFSYNSFSEGRKARLDLAIMMAWVKIAESKNSLNTNLLIFDEVLDGSLDEEGTTAFIDIIKNLTNKNVFVITHSPETYETSFRSRLKFKLVNNFSCIEI